MINIWRQIEMLPQSREPFLGDKSIENGKQSGGAVMRRSQTHFRHEFEQFVNNGWHPAFFRPKYWKRQDTGSVT